MMRFDVVRILMNGPPNTSEITSWVPDDYEINLKSLP
jgi:hypothetical protein